jgi:hypothetical protein
MATLTAARAASTFPVAGASQAGDLKVAWGSYNLLVNPTAADIIQMCRVPAGATVVGGRIYGADIDTGTETLDFDFGWAANGDEVADPDGFGNFGVVSGDAIDGNEVGIDRALGGVLRTAGPKTFTKETILQITIVATAAATGTGMITAVVYYTYL